jgi:hypothetical protein
MDKEVEEGKNEVVEDFFLNNFEKISEALPIYYTLIYT